ncbi:hypothetical protein RHMOL_Rhmol07G0104500 [Rhododendron molle]|uniref:Uncharacterized protein n=1 Tax=Rhododendron molle TaxID=49168 RepID=A0ACC0MZ55_RHOML|nr:hypothetical protein RHMOL_Rhmol07G0104500 [Rhododendron molle]
MTRCLKYISRKVHESHQQEPDSEADGPWTKLTVWRKSLVFSCNGFTVIDSTGSLVFRVDNYAGRPEEVTLMDGSGWPVLTMRHRKKLRLVDNWLVYEGEVGDNSSKKPINRVRKRMNILQPYSNVLARVYCGPSDKKSAYTIEGSYVHRSCRVLDESKQVVAEIKRKETTDGGVSFGLEVFLLMVRPGFSPSFSMAIVLILDQMFV